MRKIILFSFSIIITAIFYGCNGNIMDTMKENSTNASITAKIVWVKETEPKATSITSGSVSINWTALPDAVNYKFYYWTGSWTYYQQTATNSIVLTDSHRNDNIRIEAIDGSSNILCTSYFTAFNTYTGLNYLTSEVTGVFTDNFNDGIINSNYGQQNPAQMTESGGYLQLNQNVANNGAQLYLLYNPQGNRYVKLSFKWFQHRVNEYFIGGIYFYPYFNNVHFVCASNSHSADASYGGYGSYLQWSDGTGWIKKLLDSTEYFDAWYNREIIIDTFTGDVTLKINGTSFATQNTIFYTGGGKLFIIFTSDGWYTGYYTRLDDLSIESSNTAY